MRRREVSFALYLSDPSLSDRFWGNVSSSSAEQTNAS